MSSLLGSSPSSSNGSRHCGERNQRGEQSGIRINNTVKLRSAGDRKPKIRRGDKDIMIRG